MKLALLSHSPIDAQVTHIELSSAHAFSDEAVRLSNSAPHSPHDARQPLSIKPGFLLHSPLCAHAAQSELVSSHAVAVRSSPRKLRTCASISDSASSRAPSLASSVALAAFLSAGAGARPFRRLTTTARTTTATAR
jgi:hypothetical protein